MTKTFKTDWHQNDAKGGIAEDKGKGTTDKWAGGLFEFTST